MAKKKEIEHKVITETDVESGNTTHRFCCPKDNTWAVITEDQYNGVDEMKCPHPECNWQGKVNLREIEAKRATVRESSVKKPDHF